MQGSQVNMRSLGGLTPSDCVTCYCLLQPSQDSERGCRGRADWRCGRLESPQVFSRSCNWFVLSSMFFVVSEVKLSEIVVRNLN